ncbi:MAG: conjugal transfer protein TraG N-terminal domain-containing protein [Alphaproteobacteria bacterium]|nr:conjugal transfer protein TraG N-terminal domain-containing protein [Alphaproteobacteria bacterium]
MDHFTIYTLGGGDILWSIFNCIASLLRPDHGTLISYITSIGTVVGAGIAMWFTVFRNSFAPMTQWFLTYSVLYMGIIYPIATVHIKDSMTGKVQVVDHVPFILAFGSSVVSTLGNGLTYAVEQAFQPSPTELVGGRGMTGNLAPSYSKTGFIFGAEAIQNMKKVTFENQDIQENMYSFVNQCITYDALIGKKYTLHDLKHSDNLWELVSDRASQMRGFPWRHVERGADGKFIRSNGIEIVTCKVGAQRLNALWSEVTESSLERLAKSVGINQAWSKDQEAISNQVKAHLPGALDKFTHNAKSATDHMKQQLMISSIVKASDQKSVELGGSPHFEVRRAYTQQRETYQTIGHLIAQSLPSIKNVLEALLYCLFVFVMAFILLPNGYKILGFYFKILLWLQLWAPLFAMLNFIMTEAMSWRALSSLKGANGITLANFVGLSQMSQDMAAMAGYLCSLIPIIAWTLLEKGGYAFVSMASNLMGVSQGAASQAALEKTTGNYSYGNVGFRCVQSDNMSMMGVNTAPTYHSGYISMNDGEASMVMDSGGERIITRHESSLPVKIDMAHSIESRQQDRMSRALTFAQGEQMAATQSRQQAQNEYLEIGKSASHMLAKGHQFSDQGTYTRMQEAADYYNKVDNISQKTGLSRDYVNQKALEMSASGQAGVNVGAFALEIGGKMSKSETANMSANQVAEAIYDLGYTTHYQDAHQKMDQFQKTNSVDIQDQSMRNSLDNFSSSYEQALRHEESANKSFEEAKTLEHEIAYTKMNSATINASYNQNFADYLGDRAKTMSVPDMRNAAEHFVSTQTTGVVSGEKPTRMHMKALYEQAKSDDQYGGIRAIQTNHENFRENVYDLKKERGVTSKEAAYEQHKVEDSLAQGGRKMMDAHLKSNLDQIQAHQTLQKDMNKHAENNMGLTQEGVTKDLLKEHDGRRNGN